LVIVTCTLVIIHIMDLSNKKHYQILKKKWATRHTQSHQSLFEKHLRHLALGSVGGMLLLSAPSVPIPHTSQQAVSAQVSSIIPATSRNSELSQKLQTKLPKEMRNLNKDEETEVAQIIDETLNIKVAAEIDNKRLNRTYGVIGGEQHLYRYPGDTVFEHAKTPVDWVMYGRSGMAPGLGAWGYFAPSKAAFTKKDEERERWYIAVQTFLSPGFSERVAEYRDFYKYRKMLVINPKTGQAVVTDIADAGPGESTGKHLGGSPEVLASLGLGSGMRKGPVLYYFLDDPNDTIPLGPLKVNQPLIAKGQ
jgi:hypothetical protein